MSKPHVCMVVNNLEVGGLEKVVLGLLDRLGDHGFGLSLICLDGEGRLFSEVKLPRSNCLVITKDLRPVLPGVKSDPEAILWIRRFLHQRGVDVVHVHNRAPLIFAGIAARMLRDRPIVLYSEHNQINRAKGFDRRKFGYYAYLADEMVAVSHDLKRILVEDVKVRAPVRVIHNGIDGSRFVRAQQGDARARIRAELGIGEGEFVFGCAVVHIEQKGLRFLIDAAPEVLRRVPEARFVIAGDGPLRPDLQRRARDAGLGDRVIFPGYRSDVPELISSFDTYVLPSLWEGLPLALLEALALGKPIVASRVGGVPEIVEHGQDGFLVPSANPGALVEHLSRVARDEALRERARTRGPVKFAEQFSLEAMVDAHVRLFDELVARRRGGEVPSRPRAQPRRAEAAEAGRPPAAVGGNAANGSPVASG
ncbi:glycosyltransferase [Sorangium cellulosum]|uniref:Glycosyltransferase n=1 Tax=Sorangium cellulosum TaxID=56 RepID=A0A2L0EWV0_SORCE|nr:glycosyltransferase [Sorangium cellulosum]AUX43777.1 glycosyltransferase [Sorangium cellulosum]